MGAILLAAMVIVNTPVVKFIPLGMVHAVCGSDHEFDACTVFVSYHLDAHCGPGTAEASIAFQPMIFVHDLSALRHEHVHIEDIREYAASYVTDIEQKRFESESQCRTELDLAARTFGATMREFATRSMRHIH